MRQYTVTGMSCAACQARVEKAVSAVPGVESCAVSLLTNSMGVEGTADSADVIKAVTDAGYGAVLKDNNAQQSSRYADQQEALRDKETPVLKKRLLVSVFFLVILMYFSMGHMMWHWPVIIPILENHVALALLEMLLALIIMAINKKFFTSGFKSLLHGAPNMDTLVAMGSSASFLYSLVCLFLMIDAQGKGNAEAVHSYSMNLYFESAAMIVTLITVGKLLESISKGKTTDALKSLMSLAPETAVVERDGVETEIPVSEVRKGDIFIVRPGDSIPVDGEVISGNSAVNEAALTGESIPVDKAPGDMVSAATINTSGYMKCSATRVGEETTLSKIIEMVSDAAATKAPLARIADKVSGIFVPVVIGIAILTFLGWMLIGGRDVGFSIARAISVLVISCPCALGLATPVAVMVGSGVGAKNGILYKTAETLETLGRVKTVVLDKTGTVTKGEPVVTDVIPAEKISEDELVGFAAMLESFSEHPLAAAVVEYASNSIDAVKIMSGDLSLTDFTALPGSGLRASVVKPGTAVDKQGAVDKQDAVDKQGVEIEKPGEADILYGGNLSYIKTVADISEDMMTKVQELSDEGKTPLLFARGSKLLGIIAVADTIKEDSADAIRLLKEQGLRVVMLTGDNERTAGAVGRIAGVDEVIAGVLPDGKQDVISEIQESGKVAMVGDGINDAPALTKADTGIAIGAGADVAVDAADVVLMKNSLMDVVLGITLSRKTIRNIHENLFWAFIYNIICIPAAIGLFGFAMKPMYGAAAMSLSSFTVCMNALRLNLIKLRRKDSEAEGAEAENIIENGENAADKAEYRIEDDEENISGDGSEDKKDEGRSEDSIEDKGGKEMFGFGKKDAGNGGSGKKTIVIEGMMCEHCEATVKKALLAVEGVTDAAVSHKAGTAEVTLSKDVDDAALKKAVEDKDYKVVEIKA